MNLIIITITVIIIDKVSSGDYCTCILNIVTANKMRASLTSPERLMMAHQFESCITTDKQMVGSFQYLASTF